MYIQIKKYFLKVNFILVALSFATCSHKQLKEEQEQIRFEIVEQKSPTTQSLRGISVVDSNIAWLSGAKGTILRTVNGGRHWEMQTSPDQDSLDFRAVEAFDEEKAIVVSAGFPARVYKTDNGGKEWVLVYENLDSAAFMNSIAFRNEKEGVIIGDQLQGRHLLLRTTDGGNSWEEVDSTRVPIPLKNENGFAASGSCITIGEQEGYFIGLGGGHSRVFSSSNGENWKPIESQLKTDKPSSGIYSIASGGKLLMAVGGDYTEVDSLHYAVISEDQGISWQRTEGFLHGYRSVVDYCNLCKCWLAAGTNGIDISNDQGGSWQWLSSKSINTLQFATNTSVAYLANSKGAIYKLQINNY